MSEMFSNRDYSTLISLFGPSIEVEARFGQYSGERFVNEVPQILFNRLLTNIRSMYKGEEERTVVSSYQGDVRKIEGKDGIRWERKKKLKAIDNRAYGIRFVASKEESLEGEPVDVGPRKGHRVRTRYSFTIAEDTILDLTRVEASYISTGIVSGSSKPHSPRGVGTLGGFSVPGGVGTGFSGSRPGSGYGSKPREVDTKPKEITKTTYEVEVEFFSIEAIQNNNPILSFIYRSLYGTTTGFTMDQKESVVAYVSSILNKNLVEAGIEPEKDKIDRINLVDSRLLKLRDMVEGGLIPDGGRIGSKTPNVTYTVTHKADGIRKMMVIDKTGLWLIFPPFEFNLVAKTTDFTLLRDFEGFILDGELVPEDARLKPLSEKVWFLVFDCLATPDLKAAIQKQSHIERMRACDRISEIEVPDLIRINLKEFRGFSTSDEFFSVMRSMVEDQKRIPYKNDGFMFTPNTAPYNNYGFRTKAQDRILTKMPDITKWKDPNFLTIDFRIKWEHSDGPTSLLSSGSSPKIVLFTDRNKGELVRFSGSYFNSFDPSMVDSDHPLTKDKETGTIVEYQWDRTKRLFVPYRIRDDKFRPNREDTAIDIWDSIHRPITLDTLKGQSFSLMFQYHNKIKKALYDSIKVGNIGRSERVSGSSSSTPSSSSLTLLDIGSGAGGDITKWAKFKRIIAVEPNRDNLARFKERAIVHKRDKDIEIVNTNGENTEEISRVVGRGKADCISIMLSLTFFWKDEDTLDRLVDTIDNCLSLPSPYTNTDVIPKILFMTMDGDMVEQALNPALGGEVQRGFILNEEGQTLVLGLGDPPKIGEGKSIIIDIKDSIVTAQLEWLVFLTDLQEKLESRGIVLREKIRADTEAFLSSNERLISSMFIYGFFERVGPPKESFVRREIPPTLNKEVSTPFTKPSIPSVDVPFRGVPTSSSIKSSGSGVEVPTKVIPTSSNIPSVEIPLREIPRTLNKETPIVSEKILGGEKEEMPSLIQANLLPNPPVLQEGTIKGPVIVKDLVGQQASEDFLPHLHVGKPRSLGQPGIGDDAVEKLNCMWYDREDLYRIAVIGDGHCLIHSFLKASSAIYQNNASYQERVILAEDVRISLAFELESPVTEEGREPEILMYELISDGALMERVAQQMLDPNLIIKDGIDYSLAGLKALLNSFKDLGEEVLELITVVFSIEIIILHATRQNLRYYNSTMKSRAAPDPGTGEFNKRYCVAILANEFHYEVIGVDRETGLQTIFVYDDPFIQAILKEGRVELAPYFSAYPPRGTAIVESIFSTPSGDIVVPRDILNKMDKGEPILSAISELNIK